MAKVRVREQFEYFDVGVSDYDCPGHWCFWIDYRKKPRRCGRRDQTGCPNDRGARSGTWRKSRGVWKEDNDGKN